jgi:hypothetical protein
MDECHQECHQCNHQILKQSRRNQLKEILGEVAIPPPRPEVRRRRGPGMSGRNASANARQIATTLL